MVLGWSRIQFLILSLNSGVIFYDTYLYIIDHNFLSFYKTSLIFLPSQEVFWNDYFWQCNDEIFQRSYHIIYCTYSCGEILQYILLIQYMLLFLCWDNIQFNITFKLLFILNQYSGSVHFFHMIKIIDLKLAQFWQRLPK